MSELLAKSLSQIIELESQLKATNQELDNLRIEAEHSEREVTKRRKIKDLIDPIVQVQSPSLLINYCASLPPQPDLSRELNQLKSRNEELEAQLTETRLINHELRNIRVNIEQMPTLSPPEIDLTRKKRKIRDIIEPNGNKKKEKKTQKFIFLIIQFYVSFM